MPFKLQDRHFKLLGGTITGVIINGSILYLCFYLASDKDALVLNLSALILGITLGWLIGIVLSPYNVDEKQQFSIYAKAVSVFVSGYVVAKIDKVIEKLLSTDYLFQTMTTFRGMVLVSSLITSMLIVFGYRQYLNRDAGVQKP